MRLRRLHKASCRRWQAETEVQQPTQQAASDRGRDQVHHSNMAPTAWVVVDAYQIEDSSLVD